MVKVTKPDREKWGTDNKIGDLRLSKNNVVKVVSTLKPKKRKAK